jgi:hypothetical protein
VNQLVQKLSSFNGYQAGRLFPSASRLGQNVVTNLFPSHLRLSLHLADLDKEHEGWGA